MNIKNSWKRETVMQFVDLLLIILMAAWLLGFRLNLTPSLPEGIYRISSDELQRGDLAAFCLSSDNPFSALADERGYLGPGICPSGLRPLLKKLVGLPGDNLIVADDGLILNGELLPGTVRPSHDRQGRTLPESLLKSEIISDGFGLLLSQDHAGSFDSRHFGLIPLESLKKVNPVVISDREQYEAGFSPNSAQ